MASMVLPGMVERRGGTIINISSLAGENHLDGIWLIADQVCGAWYQRDLALEWQKFNVRVAVIAPCVHGN